MPVHCAPPYGCIQRVTHTHTRQTTDPGSPTVGLDHVGARANIARTRGASWPGHRGRHFWCHGVRPYP
eukprot:2794950-Prymnesium_polylepis.1